MADAVRRRLGELVVAVETIVEGEFPNTMLLVKLRDARFPGRHLGNYSSIWVDLAYTLDPDARAELLFDFLRPALEALTAEALPSADSDGITWF